MIIFFVSMHGDYKLGFSRLCWLASRSVYIIHLDLSPALELMCFVAPFMYFQAYVGVILPTSVLLIPPRILKVCGETKQKEICISKRNVHSSFYVFIIPAP